MRVKFALSGALLLFLGYNTIGQEITATILGTVTDASGTVASGATIIVVNTDQAIWHGFFVQSRPFRPGA